MDDDDIAWKRNSCDEPEAQSQRPGFLKLTRRDVLIGAASTLVTSKVTAAEDAHLDVYYGDSARRSIVIVWVDDQRMPGDPHHEWRLNASTFAEEKGPNSARFTLQRTSTGWRADLPGCSFPGGYKFGLRIDALWDSETPKPSLVFTMAVGGQNIVLRQDDLVAFLKSARIKSSSDEIAGSLKKAQLEELAKRLFGSTLEVDKARDVVLVFHHGGYWTLRAGAKFSAPASNRFWALSGEGVKLPFSEVAFSIFSDV